MAKLLFDTAAKLHRIVLFRGYLVRDAGETAAAIEHARLTLNVPVLGVTHKEVPPSDHASHARFEICALAGDDFNLETAVLEADLNIDGQSAALRYDHEEIKQAFLHHKYTIMDTWHEMIAVENVRRIIDIGGRARSGTSQKNAFSGKELVIADICSAPEVDIVVDVHEIASRIDEQFDAFMCISTFEHLIMPWKAAVEINRILHDGGIGLVVTHQTLGLHDMPWDFYRFSDQAWKGIFNRYTGFEIVKAELASPTMIIPMFWQKENDDAERTAGFMISACIVRKVGSPKVDWPVDAQNITEDTYNW